MKIAFFASEAVPFAKTGGLADVTGALPLFLEKHGQEVIIIMPRYKGIGRQEAIIGKSIKVRFIENEKYFQRDSLYTNKGQDYSDNLERFSYYCREGLALLKKINFRPDIIHCHDWQAALVPLYLKAIYGGGEFYKNTKSVLTIHNLGYQGLFAKEQYPVLGLDEKFFSPEALEFHGRINTLKAGIVFADLINTVSSTYAKEIQTRPLGFGLEGVLVERKKSLYGILNGVDYSVWDPAGDGFIAAKFSASDPIAKRHDKQALQQLCRLDLNKDIPLVGVVSRFAEQKGLQLLASSLDDICKLDLQSVILGTGDLKYHRLLSETAKRHPKNLSLHLKFDDPLAHKIYAGSDMFLMPSQYEPCGLGQLIALKYGAIPVVFKTGGLADTIKPERGFSFQHYTKEDLIGTLKTALSDFSDKEKWLKLVTNAMQCNFSWDESAKEYIRFYEKAKQAN